MMGGATRRTAGPTSSPSSYIQRSSTPDCGKHRGPDFQGAILAREDGLLLRGDVEIHVRASDWRRHGHQRDPAYNQTICQVVLWQDSPRPIVRQDGVAVPTIELVTRLAAPLAELERRAAIEPPVELAPCVAEPDD